MQNSFSRQEALKAICDADCLDNSCDQAHFTINDNF